MKLSFEVKAEIYKKWKYQHISPRRLSLEYGVTHVYIDYMVHLADRWGVEKLRHTWNYYSLEFKEEAVQRVLLGHESEFEVSVSLGLSNQGTLPRWIKEYITNGYTVVEKKKGRKSHGIEEDEGSSAGERSPSKRDRRSSPEERDSLDTERILKKIRCLGYGKREPRKEEIAGAVTEQRQELKRPVDFILKAIAANPSLPQISRSTYYYWLNHQDPDETKHAELMEKIREIFEKNKKRYGYRRITLQLRRDGFRINHKTVKRLMKKMNLFGITPRAKYKSYQGDFNGTVANKLLRKEVDEETNTTVYVRDFKAETSNEIWTTDVSEFPISAGKLYLSPILDLYDHAIVSYNISPRPNFQQTIDMLEKSFTANTELEGLIFHSDQGWQYQMAQYHTILQEHGINQSMSRKGNCLDNCVMENFFGKMKNEMFYGHEYEFESLEALQTAMEEYISYYNTERIQVGLKGLTPCEARHQALESR